MPTGTLARAANGGSTNPRTPFAPAGPTWLPIKDSADHVERYTVRGTISTAQVLALNATPVSLVAAPGAGKFLVMERLHLWLDYAGTAYAGVAAGEDLVVTYTDGSGEEIARVETTGFLDATADAHRTIVTGSAYDSNGAHIPVANAALKISLLSGEVITGTSPIKFEITYSVHDLEW